MWILASIAIMSISTTLIVSYDAELYAWDVFGMDVRNPEWCAAGGHAGEGGGGEEESGDPEGGV